jgi:hypothetical protein
MEAVGDKYITSGKILDAWHCPFDVDFSHAVGEMGTSHHRTVFTIHVLVKHWDV